MVNSQNEFSWLVIDSFNMGEAILAHFAKQTGLFLGREQNGSSTS
jgi:hypothetical protein